MFNLLIRYKDEGLSTAKRYKTCDTAWHNWVADYCNNTSFNMNKQFSIELSDIY